MITIGILKNNRIIFMILNNYKKYIELLKNKINKS